MTVVDAETKNPTLIRTILFGLGTTDSDHIGQGWTNAGPSFRTLFGERSDIWLDHPPHAEHYLLELDMEAEGGPQRICVAARGTVLGRSVLQGRRVLRYHLPGAVIARPAPVRITLDHEDARLGMPKPADPERKAAPLRCHALRLHYADSAAAGSTLEGGRGLTRAEAARLAGMSLDRFICGFESLGQNCEFGAVQRQCGAEPLSLFRFGAPPLFNLIDCLRTGFAHFGKLENLEAQMADNEYMILEKHAWMRYHTFQNQGEVDEKQLLEKNAARLAFLSRKLIEDVRNAEKIFVWKATNGRVLEPEIRSLHAALCEYGRVWLLWVTTADARHPSGVVEELQPGLLKGYVYRFGSPLSVAEFDLQAWLEVCVNAFLHVHGTSGASPHLPGKASLQKHFALRAPVHLAGMAHIQNRGDTQASEDGWIGLRGSRQAIEGFVVHDAPELSGGSLSYQVQFADGTLSEPGWPGQFRGTRGRNAALHGVILTLSDALQSSAILTCEAEFVGGGSPAMQSGHVCRLESAAPLEALRLTLAPRPK